MMKNKTYSNWVLMPDGHWRYVSVVTGGTVVLESITSILGGPKAVKEADHA